MPNIPVGKGNYPIEYFRNPARSGKTIRWNLLYDIIAGRVTSRWLKAACEYSSLNAQLFAVVRREVESGTGKRLRWLVDASKDPYRLLWLQSSGLFDLRIIHVIRDPRGYVYSNTVRKGFSGREGMEAAGETRYIKPYKRRDVARHTIAWVVQNGQMERLMKTAFPSSEVRQISYERLAAYPLKTIKELGNWLGLVYTDDAVSLFRKVENHAISGNPLRWGREPIRLKEEWRSEFSSKYARLVWYGTRLLGRRYRYWRK